MALQPIHIDISNEISDWKSAAKGKDVRQASVKAFTKLQEQTNKSVDYITEKGSVVDQTVLDVQETRIAAEEAVEYANVISDASKKYVDNTVEEYRNYADEKLTQTEQKLAEAEASATAAKESSETALGAAETASAQAKSAQISAGEAKRYAEQCEGAVGFDGTAQTVSAVDVYGLGSDNVQGQLDKLADGIKLPGKDISETNIGTLDTPEEEFPVPENGEKTRTFLGKIKKSMKDWKDFKNGIITLGMLSNQYENSTDKIPTSALVYALKQTTDQLNSNIKPQTLKPINGNNQVTLHRMGHLRILQLNDCTSGSGGVIGKLPLPTDYPDVLVRSVCVYANANVGTIYVRYDDGEFGVRGINPSADPITTNIRANVVWTVK